MPQAKKSKAARPSGSGASGRAAAPSRDVPPGAAPENVPPDPAAAAVPPGLARRPGNGTTRQSATSTATVPATKRPPLDMRPALPGIGPATTMPATGRAGTKAAGAKTAGATAAAAKPVAAADGGADDEVPRRAAKALEQLLHVTCWLDPIAGAAALAVG